MSNLLSSLLGSAGAMRAYDRTLNVIQNNVANASTPGYARNRIDLESLPFDPVGGVAGGVSAGKLTSARDDFLEQGVWQQQGYVGQFTQRSQSLAPLETIIGVSDSAAIPSALNALFRGFSQWSAAPNDMVARQQVLDDAGQLATSFNQAAKDVAGAGAQTDQQIRSVVTEINDIVGRIQQYNVQSAQSGESAQAGADAQAYANLENLAQLIDFTVTRQPNGTFDIRLGGGQAPLLLGQQQFTLAGDFSKPQTDIRISSGEAVTAQIGGGKLASLLEIKNSLIPSYSSGLDRLAQAITTGVNTSLEAGLDANGKPGQDLFTTNPNVPALTMAVTALSPAELAAATPAAPGGNGNAMQLAALSGAPTVDGFTFTQFYGNLASRVGRDRAASDQDQQLHQQLLAQAQSLREQASGVSLDEEAARLIEFQRAYQASARLLTLLDQLTGTIINMFGGTTTA